MKAGTHVKVKIKEKKVEQRKPKPVLKQVVSAGWSQPTLRESDEETSETDFTETEDDTDIEDYKTQKRSVRREVKKT